MIDSPVLAIIEELVDLERPDYALFSEKTGQRDVSELEFAEAYGRIVYCRRFYPGLPVPVALGVMHRNWPKREVLPSVMPPSMVVNRQGSCGGCGGGRVR